MLGLLAGFFGIGGGVILVPILTMLFHMERRKASGTSLGVVIFSAATALTMVWIQANPQGQPAYRAAFLILPFSVLASRFAAARIHLVSTGLLQRIFAFVLLFAAGRLAGLFDFAALSFGLSYSDFGLEHFLILPLLGLFVGTIAALLGIGGGVLIIPALAILFKDLTPLEWRATSVLVVVPTSFMGFLRHHKQGTALLSWVRWIAPMAILGSFLGSWFVERMDPELLRTIFGGFLGVVGVKLLLEKRR
ncbi:MAG: hypothetical protein CSA62_15365 [Planctomycetota bacterium]|nr:MAG: hypothetical protein CSA62_15365 [Planctomycetota bacterium]